MTLKICPVCKEEFKASHHKRKYCGDKCAKEIRITQIKIINDKVKRKTFVIEPKKVEDGNKDMPSL